MLAVLATSGWEKAGVIGEVVAAVATFAAVGVALVVAGREHGNTRRALELAEQERELTGRALALAEQERLDRQRAELSLAWKPKERELSTLTRITMHELVLTNLGIGWAEDITVQLPRSEPVLQSTNTPI